MPRPHAAVKVQADDGGETGDGGEVGWPHLPALADGSTVCYTDTKQEFRILCGSV